MATYLDKLKLGLLLLSELVNIVILLSKKSQILRDFLLLFITSFLLELKNAKSKKKDWFDVLTQLGMKLFGSNSVLCST